MFGTDIPGIDLGSYFDKTTILGQVLEFLIYTAIAAVVTAVILAIYNRFVKKNIRDTYPTEIYFTLVDEADKPVKLTITETSKEYIIPIFTDMREYAVGSAKISKLFLDKLEMKVVTPEDIAKIAEEDEHFQGFVINPHSQNFNMDRNGSF